MTTAVATETVTEADLRLTERVAALCVEPWRWTPHTFGCHVSGGAWRPFAFQQYIGNRIAEGVARGNARIIVNAPRRHGKSDLISFWTPAWFLDCLPHKKVILTSYEAGVATNWGRKVRNEIERNSRQFRISLREDTTAAHSWSTPEGGGMVTAGVGGPISSLGGHLMILDDAYKNWQDAYSALYRERLIEWFNSTFYTCLEPDGSVVVDMVRWADDDLTAYLTEEHSDDWEVISLKAVAEGEDVLGRKPGEALCPERYDEPALKVKRKAAGAMVWAALYQQEPLPTGTGHVYRNFSAANLDGSIVLDNKLPLDLSFDFNIDPGMHIVIGQHDDPVGELRAFEVIHEPRMALLPSLEAWWAWVKAGGGFRWPEVQVFGDATGKAESHQTGQNSYDIIIKFLRAKDVPYRIRVPKTNPAVVDGVMAFNEALRDVEGEHFYRAHPRCKQLLQDFKKLKTDAAGLIDKREHALSHASDAERYRVWYLRPILEPSDEVGGRFGF